MNIDRCASTIGQGHKKTRDATQRLSGNACEEDVLYPCVGGSVLRGHTRSTLSCVEHVFLRIRLEYERRHMARVGGGGR